MASTTNKSSARRPAKAAARMVTGRTLAKFEKGVQLVKVGRPTKTTVRQADTTTVLVRKLARAMKRPGIDDSVVFSGPNPSKVFAYSVLAEDPTRIIRTSSDGKRVVGRFVNGKFRASKA